MKFETFKKRRYTLRFQPYVKMSRHTIWEGLVAFDREGNDVSGRHSIDSYFLTFTTLHEDSARDKGESIKIEDIMELVSGIYIPEGYTVSNPLTDSSTITAITGNSLTKYPEFAKLLKDKFGFEYPKEGA